MRQLLKLAILISAVLALFGQTAAVVAAPLVADGAGMTMPADCAHKANDSDRCCCPCDAAAIACIAAAGCITAFTADMPAIPVAESEATPAAPISQADDILQGRFVQPDPHPPAILA